MNTQKHEAPAYWASYLINGDYSGIGLDEKLIADSWLKTNNLPMPVSCESAGVGRFNGMMCDLETYTFLVKP